MSAQLFTGKANVLQDGSKSLNLQGTGQERVGKEVLEHAVRLACASLIRQAADSGINAMLYRHGAAAEPGLERLMDFTVFAAAASPTNFDSCEYPGGI